MTRKHRWLVVAAAIIVAQALILRLMGQPWICDCGTVKLLDIRLSSIRARTASTIADWYSLSHVVHGFLFYGLFWLVLPRRIGFCRAPRPRRRDRGELGALGEHRHHHQIGTRENDDLARLFRRQRPQLSLRHLVDGLRLPPRRPPAVEGHRGHRPRARTPRRLGRSATTSRSTSSCSSTRPRPSGPGRRAADPERPPVTELTPREIVSELDRSHHRPVRGQARRSGSVRNRWRRQQLPRRPRERYHPKNILMIGPTGVGNTRSPGGSRGWSSAPFIKVEATKFTEVGYVGRDVKQSSATSSKPESASCACRALQRAPAASVPASAATRS